MESLKVTGRVELLARLCQNYQVVALYAFGSRASHVKAWVESKYTALPTSSSDVDIGVNPAPGKKLSVREKVRS